MEKKDKQERRRYTQEFKLNLTAVHVGSPQLTFRGASSGVRCASVTSQVLAHQTLTLGGCPQPGRLGRHLNPGGSEATRLIEDEGVEAFFSNSFEIGSSTIKEGRRAQPGARTSRLPLCAHIGCPGVGP